MTLQGLITRLQTLGEREPELLDREVWLHHPDWDCRYPIDVDVLHESPDGWESYRRRDVEGIWIERESDWVRDCMDEPVDPPDDPRNWPTCVCVFSTEAE